MRFLTQVSGGHMFREECRAGGYFTRIFTITVLVEDLYHEVPLAVTLTLTLYVPRFVPLFTTTAPVFVLKASLVEHVTLK